MAKISKFTDYYSKTFFHGNKAIVNNIVISINDKMSKINRQIKIMHICGTHEATVARSGMRSILPKELVIKSGPGCPVCICPAEHIAKAINLSEENIVVTFGDMLKVPDPTLTSLAKARASGHHINVVYSVLDAIRIAKENPNKNIVWLGIGFETTAPMTSFVLENNKLENFFVLPDFRLVPPAMHLLASNKEFDLDGFILPGHVSTIIGVKPYRIFPKRYNLPCIIAGFEPIDFLISIDRLLDQVIEETAYVDNAYPRVVKEEGNIIALKSITQVFKTVDAKWRGIGIIPRSGFGLQKEFEERDANLLLDETIEFQYDLPKGCRCGQVILGQIEPEECAHFLRRCTPETAIGPCMVSDEGTCRIRASYKEVKILTE